MGAMKLTHCILDRSEWTGQPAPLLYANDKIQNQVFLKQGQIYKVAS